MTTANIKTSIETLEAVFKASKMNEKLTHTAIEHGLFILGCYVEGQMRQADALERIANVVESHINRQMDR